MDHLPRVQHPVYPQLEVPYLCSEKYAYDGKGDLFDFPLRVGLSREQFPKFLRGEYLPMTWNEALSFLQEWAFFGLLSETLHIVGLGFSKDDFIRKDDDGSQWITNKRLSSTLKEWELVARECGSQQRQSHAHSISNLIYGVTGLITRLVTSDSLGGYTNTSFFANEPSTPGDTLSPARRIILSILVLAETLTYSSSIRIYSDCDTKEPEIVRCDFLDGFMRRAGWCPHDVLVSSYQLSLMANSVP